jgi:hypothetical protein
LLPNVALKHGGKALINLVDDQSSGSVVLVGVADGDLVDHAQAIVVTFLVVVEVLLGSDGLGND